MEPSLIYRSAKYCPGCAPAIRPRGGLRAVTILLALLGCSGQAGDLPGQTRLSLSRLTSADGLSYPSVRCILQDADGYLWLGSEDGLNRYDGYAFDVFTHRPDEPDSLSSSWIGALAQTDETGIWVGTAAGLDFLDTRTDTVRSVRADWDVQALAPSGSGGLWIGTRLEGLFHLAGGSGSIEPIEQSWLEAMDIRVIMRDSKGRLWVGSGGSGLTRYDPDSGTTLDYRSGSGPRSLDHDFILALCEDRRGAIWVGTYGGGLHRIDAERDTVRMFRHTSRGGPRQPSHNVIWSLLEDSSGRIWVGTYGGGLNRFDPETELFTSFRHDPLDPAGLAEDNVWSLFEDRTGQLWIGTNGGVSHYDPARNRFGHQLGEPPGGRASGSTVRGFVRDSRNRFWVATETELLCSDTRRHGYRSYTWDPNDPGSISDDEVWCLAEDRAGRLWVGTANGLNRYDDERDRFTRYLREPDNPESLSHSSITALGNDAAGRMWVGTYGGGLNLYVPDRDRFIRFRHEPRNPLSLSHNSVSAIYLDETGRLWIGTLGGGLNEYLPGSGAFVRHGLDPSRAEKISTDEVFALFRDTEGSLWVGTRNGLIRTRPGPPGGMDALQTPATDDTLPDDAIMAIQPGTDGRLWLSTDHGLIHFSPDTGAFRRYTVHDGLQSDTFVAGAGYRDGRGNVYFGGTNGFNAFRPESIQPDPHPPLVHLADLLLFNQSVRGGELDDGDLRENLIADEEIGLDYHQDVLTFELVGLHFEDPDRIRYAYKMEGMDKDWLETDAEKRAITYHLTPGTYRFSLKAANPDGVWSEEKTVRLRLSPPPWRSAWAYVVYALMGSFLILQSLRLTRERRQAEHDRRAAEQERLTAQRLRQLDRVKDQILANTSHELRTPLNGIIGLTESIIGGAAGPIDGRVAANLTMVAQSGRRLSNLVNDILDFSKLQYERPDLHRTCVNLSEQAETVLAMSRPLVGNKPVRLVNRIAADTPPVTADEERLQQVLFNLVGNAVKFTDSGQVTLTATWDDEKVVTRVVDTGIGIPPEKQARIFESFEQADGSAERSHGGTGLGLAISRQLIELHGGHLEVSSAPGKGSTFSFTLPRSREPAPAREPATPGEKPPVEVAVTDAGSGDRGKILIVDDEPINRQVLINYLAGEGFAVTQLASGEDALTAFADGKPYDLVIADVMMPRMSGYELCGQLRARFPREELPILILTARNRLGDIQTGFAAGASDYLTKPVSREELLARVELHLGLSRSVSTLEDSVRYHEDRLARGRALLSKRERDALIGTLVREAAEEIAAMFAAAWERTEGEAREPTTRNRIVELLPSVLVSREEPVDHLDLSDLAAKLVGTVPRVYREAMEIRTDLEPELLVRAKPAALSLIFMALIRFARVAVSRDGDAEVRPQLVIRTRLEGGMIAVHFTDNGPGIQVETREHLFDPLYAHEEPFAVPCVGLALAQELAGEMGGTIHAVSTPGKGTLLTLWLPAEEA